MDVPLPPGAKILPTDEGVRRIQERDHVLAPGTNWMSFDFEQAMIHLLREGVVFAVLATDGQLGFVAAKDHDGTPFNVIETPTSSN